MQFSSFAQNTILYLPTAAGGSTHRLALALQAGIEKALGNQMNIEFHPGAKGALAAKKLKDHKKTDIALFIGSPIRTEVSGVDYQKDIIPIAFLGTTPGVLITSKNTEYKDYKEFINFSKKNITSYGTVTNATYAPLFQNLNKTQNTLSIEVPFGAATQIINSVLGGHVDVGVTTVEPVSELIKQKKLIALGVWAPHRSKLLPNTPTLAELGLYDPDYFKYFLNNFLWVNATADPTTLANFKNNLYAYLNTEEAKSIFYKLDIQLVYESTINPKEVLFNILN